MRKKDPERKEQLQQFLVPQHFDFVMRCVRELAGFDDDVTTLAHHAVRAPNLALKLGHDFKKLSLLMQLSAARSQDKQLRREAKDFDAFVTGLFNSQVSSRAVKVSYKLYASIGYFFVYSLLFCIFRHGTSVNSEKTILFPPQRIS